MTKTMIAVWQPDAAALGRFGEYDTVIRHALPDQGRYGGGAPFDVLVTTTVNDPDGLDLADLGERIWAWTVDERRPRVGDEECAVTMVALMRRKPELTPDQFREHWTTRHTPLALAHHAGPGPDTTLLAPPV